MIITNAGHGGKDPGASGNGIIEKHFTLDVDNYYTSDLNRQGIGVERTRTTDSYQSPSSIGRQIRDSKKQIGVSHHANKFSSNSANGVEVLYNPKSAASKRLAECILAELVKLGLTNRKTKARTNLAVLNIPSPSKAVVIIEYGFMSNKNDADILKNKTKELGQAAAKGTLNYMGIKYVEEEGGGENKMNEDKVLDIIMPSRKSGSPDSHWAYKHYVNINSRFPGIMTERRFDDVMTRGEVAKLIDIITKDK